MVFDSWNYGAPEEKIFFDSDTTVYAIWKQAKPTYSISVENAEHTIGDREDAILTVKRDPDDKETYNLYTGATMDGAALPEGSNLAEKGSLKLTLKSSYLNTLSVGEHILKISFIDGSIETLVKIIEAKSLAPTQKPVPTPTHKPVPKTGDSGNPILWLILILLGIIMLAILLGKAACKSRK